MSLPAGFSLQGDSSYSRGTNAPKHQAGVFNTNLPEMPPLRTLAALRYTFYWALPNSEALASGGRGRWTRT